MQTITDLGTLHRRAIENATAVLDRVTGADLTRPTPCAGWNLGTLIGHVIGQNHGFAEAVEGGDAPVEAFAGRPPDTDRIDDAWRASADRLTAAFERADPDRQVRLVEISRDVTFPLATVVGFQLLDTVVHTWDIATALGEPFRPDDELIAATLAQAQRVPSGPARTRPGAAFASALTLRGDDDWSGALALLGRR